MFKDYIRYLKEKEDELEKLCRRCGACCGAEDDPCIHLKKDTSGKYYCDIYPHRFGEQVTVSGEKFRCVPIRDILHTRWKGDYKCAYKNNFSQWIKKK